VSRATNADETQPVEPVYPFNEPGEPIVVHEGPVGGFNGRVLPGVIELRCSPNPKMAWRLDTAGVPSDQLLTAAFADDNGYRLRISRPYGEQDVAVQRNSVSRGWIDPVALGSETAPLDRLVVHWMNLPDLRFPSDVGAWNLSVSQRGDHREVWEKLGNLESIAVTHAMALSRRDGRPFSAADASVVVDALQFGMSFALGRWVAPALPVGLDENGNIAWEQWASWHCEPGRSHGLAWWHYPRHPELREYLPKILAAMTDPDRVDAARLLISMAIQANQAGFVEQRIMTAFSGIEYLSWIRLVLAGELTAREFKSKDWNAARRLRTLLARAKVSPVIDAETQPKLTTLANGTEIDEPRDGAATVAYVRNRITHPKRPHDDIYRHNGLLTESWLLTRHYLTLLILQWLGYEGTYQKILGSGGWSGDVIGVPWADREAEPT